MKNKRNVLIAFILICCLCLSIGYASLSDVLTVTGRANVNVVSSGDGNTVTDDDDTAADPTTAWETKFDNDVYFQNPKDENKNVLNASVYTLSADKDTFEITVPADTFTPNKTSVVYYVEIKNDSLYNAQIRLANGSSVKSDNSAGNFSVACAWENSVDATNDDIDNVITTSEQTQLVKITITLNNTTSLVDIPTETFTITYDVAAVA